LTGTIAAIYKRWWCFLIFAATNIFWFVYDLRLGAYAQAAVFAGYMVINLFGACKWLREGTRKREEL
jgi:hypothetical protein